MSGSTRVGEGQSSRVVGQVPTNRVPARITSFGGHVVRPWRGSATLACNAVGDPTREWYKGTTEQIRADAARNVQILSTGELVLSNLQSQDSGNYTCQVENSQGSDKLHYTLTVQGNDVCAVALSRLALNSDGTFSSSEIFFFVIREFRVPQERSSDL